MDNQRSRVIVGGAEGAPDNSAHDVWVVVEQHDGVPAEVSLELLGRARELAAKLQVGWAPCSSGPARRCRRWPPTSSPTAPTPCTSWPTTTWCTTWRSPTPPSSRRSCASTARRSCCTAPPPRAATWRRAWPAPCAPASPPTAPTCASATTRIKGVEYRDLLYQIRPAFGGNIIATIVSPQHRPQMATVREGVMVMPQADPRPRGPRGDRARVARRPSAAPTATGA